MNYSAIIIDDPYSKPLSKKDIKQFIKGFGARVKDYKGKSIITINYQKSFTTKS